MNHQNKITPLGLIFAILILNCPFAKSNSCQSEKATVKMTCCSDMVTSAEWVGENFTSASCACQITDGPKTPIPVTGTVQLANPCFKNITKNFGKIYSSSNFSFGPPLVSTRFEIFFQPKSTKNLKIYDLLSSYLI